ncbi:MAG: NAD(P)-dependent oxidoreductase [Magnetospirillum sp.]|nr:NAD(P)-dependent oxidoreductase [Magnetospirillum sp.]
MTRTMLQFTAVAQRMPDKRDPVARRHDFTEVALPLSAPRTGDQASRCEQCGVPFCQVACPVANTIPDWLMLAAAGRMEEAYAAAAATNPLPEICGRICPQDRLCEGACVLEQSGHGAVTIGAVERAITEHAFAAGWVTPPSPRVERPGSVGIVGRGPAGLAAAEALRRQGWSVTVADRADRAGGLLTYGIPGFKLDKAVVERRIALYAAAGIRFETGVEIGGDLSFAEFRARHDAVLIATGVYRGRPLDVPGCDLRGVEAALPYLIAQNRRDLGEALPGALDAKGKTVVVIGGGDTAMDCVRTAIRQGARSVTCLYRRDRANMPGSAREVAHAEEEGVAFEWMAAPEAILGGPTVTGVRAHRMHLGIADGSGRRTPARIDGSAFTLPADLVIAALGFEPEDVASRFGLAVGRRGTIAVDPRTQATSIEGVFAAGDIVRGASLVVWAIKDGRDAAASIDAYLRAKIAQAAE